MPGKQRGHQRRLCRSAPVWQRALLGFYIALFALVLPLICWGALAEPGHPHRYPHFVFAQPVLATAKADHDMADPPRHSSATQLPVMHKAQHHAAQAVAAPQAPVAAVCRLIVDGVVPGRATPMLMAFSLLLLVFLGVWAIRRLDQPHFVLWQRPHFPESLFLPVPLPPPRLFCCLFSIQA